MRAVKDACLELVGQLKAAGFTGSSVDPDLVNPPSAVWVQPRTIRDLTLGDTGTLTAYLYVLAGNVETERAMTLLDDSLAALLELGVALDPAAEAAVDLTAAVLLPGHSQPMPAYRLAITLDL